MNSASQPKSHDFTAARSHMIESQLRPNLVRDEKILTAMETLPRELFVPAHMAGIAYCDEDLQVAPTRYLLEPMVLARLLEAALIKPDDKVLDVAPATGYSTAVLASLVKEVIAVESEVALQKQAAFNLASLRITNAHVIAASMTDGWAVKAPYDVIVINGSVDTAPTNLFTQLNEGGRLVTVLRHAQSSGFAHTGEAKLYEKIRGAIASRTLFDANVKPVPGFESAPSFVF